LQPALVDSSGDEGGVVSAISLVEEVLAAARAADGQDAVDEAATRRLRHHGLAGTSLWLADQAGFAWRHDDELDLVVRPDARGRGLGAALARAAATTPGALSAWSHGDDPRARSLAASLDFEAVRALWVMRRPLAGLDPVVVLPGTTVRAFRDHDLGDRDAVLRINAEAFAHHPEQGGMDVTDMAERMAEPWWDPDGLLLAVDETTGEVLGFHWTKRHSPTLGEVYVVGIAPAAQGRGLGKVLTLAGLHHLAGLGCTEVLLYVESDNLPARAVYAGLGFTHADADTHVQYRRA